MRAPVHGAPRAASPPLLAQGAIAPADSTGPGDHVHLARQSAPPPSRLEQGSHHNLSLRRPYGPRRGYQEPLARPPRGGVGARGGRGAGWYSQRLGEPPSLGGGG